MAQIRTVTSGLQMRTGYSPRRFARAFRSLSRRHTSGQSRSSRCQAWSPAPCRTARAVLSRSPCHPLLSPIPCLVTDPHCGSDMQSWLPTAVGMIAGCFSTVAFVPQVLKIWREGDTRAISTRMYVLRDLGFVLWLAYGFALRSTPLVVFILSLLLGGTILVLKLRGKARAARTARAAAPDYELGPAA